MIVLMLLKHFIVLNTKSLCWHVHPCIFKGIHHACINSTMGDEKFLILLWQVQGEILRITQATMEDRGVYICSVSNVAGRAQASGIVEIESK